MCGIYGWIRNPEADVPDDILNILENLKNETSIRGTDATGIIAKVGSDIIYKRMVGHPKDFNLREVLKNRIPDVLVGHDRAASRGSSKKVENAHPFWYKGYALVHNGTLHFGREIKKLTKEKLKGETDSEQLLVALVESGLDWGIIKDMYGSLAIVLYNPFKEKLWFFREMNPLYLSLIKGGHIVFASTEEILKSGLKRSRKVLNFFEVEKKNLIVTIKELPKKEVWEFDIKEFNFSKIAEVETGYYYSGYGGYFNDSYSNPFLFPPEDKDEIKILKSEISTVREFFRQEGLNDDTESVKDFIRLAKELLDIKRITKSNVKRIYNETLRYIEGELI